MNNRIYSKEIFDKAIKELMNKPVYIRALRKKKLEKLWGKSEFKN